jgi:hypothetical protein
VIKLMGQIAGVAGISLGVVFLLFREALQKSFLHKLRPTDAYRLAKLVVVLAWSIGIVGIGAWMWAPARRQNQARAKQLPRTARPARWYRGSAEMLILRLAERQNVHSSVRLDRLCVQRIR